MDSSAPQSINVMLGVTSVSLTVVLVCLYHVLFRHIQVRFHSGIPRDGYFLVRSSGGHVVVRNFSVRRPERLRKLSRWQLTSMFDQALSQGYIADHLVIEVDLVCRTYHYDYQHQRIVPVG